MCHLHTQIVRSAVCQRTRHQRHVITGGAFPRRLAGNLLRKAARILMNAHVRCVGLEIEKIRWLTRSFIGGNSLLMTLNSVACISLFRSQRKSRTRTFRPPRKKTCMGSGRKFLCRSFPAPTCCIYDIENAWSDFLRINTNVRKVYCGLQQLLLGMVRVFTIIFEEIGLVKLFYGFKNIRSWNLVYYSDGISFSWLGNKS